MEWYMRVYKFGPYLGLPEKGVGARGGLSLLQADVDFLDDAEFLALGRIASRGLTVARVHNQKVIWVTMQIRHFPVFSPAGF